MRYLELALFAEGPTDYRFLSPILSSVCKFMKNELDCSTSDTGMKLGKKKIIPNKLLS